MACDDRKIWCNALHCLPDGRRIPLIYFLILEIKKQEEMKDVEKIMASTDVVFQADLTSKSEVEKDGRKWRKV